MVVGRPFQPSELACFAGCDLRDRIGRQPTSRRLTGCCQARGQPGSRAERLWGACRFAEPCRRRYWCSEVHVWCASCVVVADGRCVRILLAGGCSMYARLAAHQIRLSRHGITSTGAGRVPPRELQESSGAHGRRARARAGRGQGEGASMRRRGSGNAGCVGGVCSTQVDG